MGDEHQLDESSVSPSLRDDQRELSRILRFFKHDPTCMGVWSLGKDGVFRSLTADRKVVDAVGLPPRLIKALLDRMPFNPQNEIDFLGADGTRVPQEQWWKPDSGLLPPPLIATDEQRAEVAAKAEGVMKSIEERRSRDSRPPTILSNHDLGIPKTT